MLTWLMLTGIEGQSVLVNMTNVLRVEPLQTARGGNAILVTTLPGEITEVLESIDEIARMLVGAG